MTGDGAPKTSGPDRLKSSLLYCICPPGKNSQPLQRRTVNELACTAERRSRRIAFARQANRASEGFSFCENSIGTANASGTRTKLCLFASCSPRQSSSTAHTALGCLSRSAYHGARHHASFSFSAAMMILSSSRSCSSGSGGTTCVSMISLASSRAFATTSLEPCWAQDS